MQKTKIKNPGKTVRLMFEDEASFGRINKPKYCCLDPVSPAIKEVQVCFWLGGVFNGGKIFLVMPNCDTSNMSVFLKELSKSYNDDIVILVCYGGVWHKSKNLEISGNIIITHIPPYTPEMNPIEQI